MSPNVSGQHGRWNTSRLVTDGSLLPTSRASADAVRSGKHPGLGCSPGSGVSTARWIGPDGAATDDVIVEQNRPEQGRRRSSSAALLILAVGCVLACATDLVARPPGPGWNFFFGTVARNAVWIPAIVACGRAAGRVVGERLAWRALTVSLVFNASANVVRPFVAEAGSDYSSALLAMDVLSLGAYLTLWVTLLGLVRTRVPRSHPSMWLDGVIGASGAGAVGLAFRLGPYLVADTGREPLPLLQLALPVTDVLLVALLVAVGSILGLRLDRTAVLLTVALSWVFVGDLLLFTQTVRGSHVYGTALELTWLTGMLFVTLAAHLARPAGRVDAPESRTRLGHRLQLAGLPAAPPRRRTQAGPQP